MDISNEELDEFIKLANILNLDEKTKALTMNFYGEFKRKSKTQVKKAFGETNGKSNFKRILEGEMGG